MDRKEFKELSEDFKSEISKEYCLFSKTKAAFVVGSVATFLATLGIVGWKEAREVGTKAAIREVEARVGTNVLRQIGLASEKAALINSSLFVDYSTNGGSLRIQDFQIFWGSISVPGQGQSFVRSVSVRFANKFAFPPQLTVSLLPVDSGQASIWNCYNHSNTVDGFTCEIMPAARRDSGISDESVRNTVVHVEYVAIGKAVAGLH